MITFTKEAWNHYLYWQSVERKIVERINMLIKDILRDPFHGIGKAEPLKGQLSGFWSRGSTMSTGWSINTETAK